jgi:hypothetical protein
VDASGVTFGVLLIVAGTAGIVLSERWAGLIRQVGERLFHRPIEVNPLGLVAAAATWLLLGIGLVLKLY